MMQRSATGPSFSHHHVAHGQDSDDESEHGELAMSSGDEHDSDFELHEAMHESTGLVRRASKDLEAIALRGIGKGGQTEKASEGVEHDSVLSRDRQKRTPHYSERHERQMSHIEARQFYQNQQRANTIDEETDGTFAPVSASPAEGRSPVMKTKTLSSTQMAGGGLGRTDSIRSRTSNQSVHDGVYQSALPVGLCDPNKPPESPQVQAPDMGRFGGVNGITAHKQQEDPYLQADHAAQFHALHPNLPHESKPELAQEGIHGAGAGIGIDAAHDSNVMSELNAIYTNIQKILDIRHKYIRLSLQGPFDDPRDDSSWEIYPPMPDPVWHDNKERRNGTKGDEEAREPETPTKKPRKMGHSIGDDFNLDECLPLPGEVEMTYQLDDSGIYQVYENSNSADLGEPIVHIPDIREYYMDLDSILSISSDGPSKSFAYRRLEYLEGKFHLYKLLNEYQEVADTKAVPHRDFYNVRKVDTHVHHSACMNQKHLLRFIKSKMKKCPNEEVIRKEGKMLTLQEVFDSIKLTAYDLSIDTLDMHAHTDSFHRFDKFNLKYNPVGESRLRTIFLKTDNDIHGRYLAELTREVIEDLESSKYQMVEWRVSIYGRNINEWEKLAAWVVDNKLFSPNVRWLIQVPRLYDVYKSSGNVQKYEDIIVNVFQPLFAATHDPSSYPKLHMFLQRVIGFDCVDDESKVERRIYRKFPLPKVWNTKQNPPYSYWIYYLFANIASLNVWRKQRGFNTFVLRPHCGEAGDTDHLAAAVLCCHSISHGLLLRKVPLIQYIFYLEQIGIAMSPLSNNALFLAYERNPFPQYFRRGLNVSLSSDDPLQFAYTKEPLIEEYAVAAQIYKLTPVDMCELAKHSVVQSGFEHSVKQRWLGKHYHLPGVAGNDMPKVNVPNIREAFRHETWLQEVAMIDRYSSAPVSAQLSAFSLPSQENNHTPASPTISMKTHPSATNPLSSMALSSSASHSTLYANPDQDATPHTYVPNAQAARQQQQDLSQAQQEGTTPLARRTLTGKDRPRSGSFVLASPIPEEGQVQVTSYNEAATGIPTGSLSHEPKIFPGVVTSSRRRSSVSRAASIAMPPAEQDGDGMKSSTGSLKRDGDGLMMGGGLERRATAATAGPDENGEED